MKGGRKMKRPELKDLTLREKIGQMLLPYQYNVYINKEGGDMDFLNTNEDPKYLRTDEEVREYIQKENFGSYYFEQTEITKMQTIDLTDTRKGKLTSKEHREFLRKQDSFGKIPAFMAGDIEAEGAGNLFSDLSIVCRPPCVGAANSEELAYQLAKQVAKEARCIGANWRWAPVIDIGGRYSGTVLRSTTPDDPDRMIKLALAHIRGSQDEGVAATAKHFPGSGFKGNYRDSHFCPNANPLSLEEWWEGPGKVFQGVIDGGVYSVMISHQAFPAVDDSKLKGRYRPCTVSKKVVTDLLKGEMGFSGVVVTDGIPMAALLGAYDNYSDLVIDLVNAGNDVLLGVYKSAGDIIEKAVKEGKIKEERIDDACMRIFDMKEKIGLFEDGYWDKPYNPEEIVPETKRINKLIAERAITLICDNQKLLPLDAGKIKNVTVVCSTHQNTFYDKLKVMINALEERGMNVNIQRRISSNKEMEQIAEKSDLIIYAAYVSMHQPKGFMTLYEEECETFLYAFSKGGEKSIGVSFGYPHLHFEIMGNSDTFINAYGTAPELMESFVEAIFGEIPIVGESTVELYPDHVIKRIK